MTDPYKNVCLSGGANGADLEWGKCARKNGHEVIHYSFKGHFTQAYNRNAGFVQILSPEQLVEADKYLASAAPKLKKWYTKGRDPESRSKESFISNLLRRNWWQVRDTERVYAVTTIKDGIVQGGTAWAVQMFIDRREGRECECYVYDQDSCRWYRWIGRPLAPCLGWADHTPPPPPHGRWTGIGSRDLSPAGKAAIRALMGL